MKNKIVYLTILALILCIPSVFSLSIGLTPADLDFDNVLVNGYAEVEYTLMTDAKDPITILLVLDDNDTIQDWITYDPLPRYVNVSEAKPWVGKVKIRIPQDTLPGVYVTNNKFTVLQSLQDEGETTAQITIGIGQKITINVTENRVSGCQVYSYSVGDEIALSKTMSSSMFVQNFGNVPLDTVITYTISTMDGKQLVKEDIPLQLEATVAETIPLLFQTQDLAVGQYLIKVSAPTCEYESSPKQVFVSAAGQEKSRGSIISHEAPLRVNGTVPKTISINFANEGKTILTARLIGKVMKGDAVVSTFTSEDVSIPVGQSYVFTKEITPKSSGRHTIEVSVEYNGLQTPPYPIIINFLDNNGEANKIPWFAVVVGIIIVILVGLIVHKKKKKHHGTRTAL